MKRIVVLLVVLVGCTTTSDPPESTTTTAEFEPTTSTTTPPVTTTTLRSRQATQEALARLTPGNCPSYSEFTCVDVLVPLDHFDNEDNRTMFVTFAVRPASAQSRGAIFVATGGPGSSGVDLADTYMHMLYPMTRNFYDLIFFDQRGIGPDERLSCRDAYAAYTETETLGTEGINRVGLFGAAEKFARDCLNEAGNPGVIDYVGTAQVVEDIEVFRGLLGYDSLIMWGESYGTAVAQTYAHAYPQRLERMVLDGVIDLTLEAGERAESRSIAFNEALQAVFDECWEDIFCYSHLGDAGRVFDRLIEEIREGPLETGFPLPDGGTGTRTITLSDLEWLAATSMYTEGERMLLMRALAAYRLHDDLVPLARLIYSAFPADVETLDDLEVEVWSRLSEGVFYGVTCADHHFPGGTATERARGIVELAERNIGSRFGYLALAELPCAYWPYVRDVPGQPPPLRAEGVPTLVLSSTLDPATPLSQAISVFESLDDAHMITKTGGGHTIFGRGSSCPDDAVNEFIFRGTYPDYETCEGVVVWEFIPLFPVANSELIDAQHLFWLIEVDLVLLPEFQYWTQHYPIAVGCRFGGSIVLGPKFDGVTADYQDCKLSPELAVTGGAIYEPGRARFLMEEVDVNGCKYFIRRVGDDYAIQGECPTLFGSG